MAEDARFHPPSEDGGYTPYAFVVDGVMVVTVNEDATVSVNWPALRTFRETLDMGTREEPKILAESGYLAVILLAIKDGKVRDMVDE